MRAKNGYQRFEKVLQKFKIPYKKLPTEINKKLDKILKNTKLTLSALKIVGMTGFEPATPCTPCKYATGLRHIPILTGIQIYKKQRQSK